MANKDEVTAVRHILLEACQGPKAQMHPWKPFDLNQVAIKIVETITLMRGSKNG